MRKQKTKLPTSFKVSQAHIDLGIQRSAIECPIALALRAVGIVAEVRSRGAVYADRAKGTVDPVARAFITTFDNYGRKMVTPFELKIDWEK